MFLRASHDSRFQHVCAQGESSAEEQARLDRSMRLQQDAARTLGDRAKFFQLDDPATMGLGAVGVRAGGGGSNGAPAAATGVAAPGGSAKFNPPPKVEAYREVKVPESARERGERL